MYRLIACDLDETLLPQTKQVSRKNQAAVQAAQNKGTFFVPATGRGYYSILNTLKELKADNLANHYMIGFNGGIVIENNGPTIIQSNPLAFSLVEQIFAVGQLFDVAIHLYTLDQTYVFHTNDDERDYLKAIPHTVQDTDDLNPYADQIFYKMLFQNLDRSYLELIENSFPEDLKAQLEFSYSSNRYLEINPKGVNKGAALKALADHLDIPISETIAIGDNTNDLSMIQAAGLGVAVQNAIPQIKEVASYTTITTNEESAVAEVIEKFIL